MAEFILFGTDGCHLCDDAELLLRQAGLEFAKQDIIADEQAQLRYGIRIPVLLQCGSGRELDWPFDLAMLQEFAAS